MFPLPFEYKAIEYDWKNVKSFILGSDVSKWKVRPHRTLLAPKAHIGFRVITQLDPLDFLVFAATVLEMGPDIEKRRLPVLEAIVFSYRIKPDINGQLFDPQVGYSSFQNKTREILASDSKHQYIALADIADFYHRIYHHRLDGALQTATSRASHIGTIRNLLAGWNITETYGIPVGSSPARLLAEITIADIDDALRGAQFNFIRYSDDFRIFTSSYAEAYRSLVQLAQILYRNHGLTLQPQKTMILEREEFQKKYLPSPEDRELESLQDRFNELVELLDLSNRYDPINYDDLDNWQKEIIDSMNLLELFADELKAERLDMPLMRFIIRRLSQLGDNSILSDLMSNLERLHPIFTDIIGYLASLDMDKRKRRSIGKQILALLGDSIISELDYHRMWALDLFTKSTDWNNEKDLPNLLAGARDQQSKRKLILAMGKAKHGFWFQSQWRNMLDEPPWSRRAMIYGFSCLPPDTRKHWYKAVERQLDPLELAVMRWARNNPIS